MKPRTLIALIGLPAVFAAGYALAPAHSPDSRRALTKTLSGTASSSGQALSAAAGLKEIRSLPDPLEARLRLRAGSHFPRG